MSNQLRFPASLFRLAAIVPAAIALTTFLCPPQSIAQITVGPFISELDIPQYLPQSMPVTCANYDSFLSATGVVANGRSHPGGCRSTGLTPLFDGMQLGSNMQSFLGSPTHPPLFTIKTTQGKGQYCATNSKLKVTLSASLQATALQWTSAPVVGSACTEEVARVNAVHPSSAVVQRTMSALLQKVGRELALSPQLSGCGPTAAAATLALDQQVWKLLQRVANYEVTAFEVSGAPAIDATSSCAAKCNLCFSGWVGSIQCTATVIDPNPDPTMSPLYQWNETQTWDVGGLPTLTGGITYYPAKFTATGKGSKFKGPSWTINATQMGTLKDGGVNTSKRLSTSNDIVPNAIFWDDHSFPPSEDTEIQVQFNADQVGGSIASNDPIPTVAACIQPPERPSVPCNVSCNWHLVKQ